MFELNSNFLVCVPSERSTTLPFQIYLCFLENNALKIFAISANPYQRESLDLAMHEVVDEKYLCDRHIVAYKIVSLIHQEYQKES